ncbi:MAG TPA: hypothetical protein VJ727_01865 [Rhodanobacteraceae bacterium]|nr:hypothetical protein [Rhodanobacteraceae bacterium]
MSARPSLFSELKRRNVLRAAALYAGAVWAFGQGLSQFSPALGLPDVTTRWFLIAAAIGFPFWIAFAWLYEFTPQGLKRESEIAADDSFAHSTGRKLDKWIIAVLAIAVVLLLTDRFVSHKQAGGITDKSIAVLPLNNDSGEKDQQYFSDGLSEDLITALSQFAGLKVIARDSSFKFRNSTDDAKTIGEKLGVAHLLEGSVQRAGDTVRVSATLINAVDGSAIWSQHYDRPYKDLFALQDDITRQVASALKAKLLDNGSAVLQSDRPPSGNLAAWDAFLKGQFYFQLGTEEDFRRAIEQFTAATRLDPDYAAAYAAAAQTRVDLTGYYLEAAEWPHSYAQVRVDVDAALRLNPVLAAAHVANSSLLCNADANWEGWLTEARRAVVLAPENAGAYFQLSTAEAGHGRVASAVRFVEKAVARNPLNGFWRSWLAYYLASLGRLDEAATTAQQGIALQSQGALNYRILTYIEVVRGDAAAALAAAGKAPTGRNRDIAMAWALQLGSDRAAADAALAHLIAADAGNSSYQIAQTYALRRDPASVFEWLDRARADRDGGIQYLAYDPIILRYKDDPRFIAFAKKVGLPTTTDAKAMP